MKLIKHLWRWYSNQIDEMDTVERLVVILALLILGSIWLIFDVTPIHK